MAWKLGRPLITVACNEDMTASDLVGRFLLDKDGTKWQDGPLTTAARIGAICYLDEIVEARQDTTVVIHPLTDHRRQLPLDKKGEIDRCASRFPARDLLQPRLPVADEGPQAVDQAALRRARFRLPRRRRSRPRSSPTRPGSIPRPPSKLVADRRSASRNLKGHGLDEGISTRLLVYAGQMIAEGVDPQIGLPDDPGHAAHRRPRHARDAAGGGRDVLRLRPGEAPFSKRASDRASSAVRQRVSKRLPRPGPTREGTTMTVNLDDYRDCFAKAPPEDLRHHRGDLPRGRPGDERRRASPIYMEGAKGLCNLGRGHDLVLAYLENMPAVAKECGEDVIRDCVGAAMKLVVDDLRRGDRAAVRDAAHRRAPAGRPGAAARLSPAHPSALGQGRARPAPDAQPSSTSCSPSSPSRACKRWANFGADAYRRDLPNLTKYFSLESADAKKMLQQERRGTLFIDTQRKLNFYLRALWGRDFFLRPTAADYEGFRPYIEHHVMHLPDAVDDIADGSGSGLDLYRAMTAHLAAHIAYTTAADLGRTALAGADVLHRAGRGCPRRIAARHGSSRGSPSSGAACSRCARGTEARAPDDGGAGSASPIF